MLYNRKGWPLCACVVCSKREYIEPHGTTAACPSLKCKGAVREFVPITDRTKFRNYRAMVSR